MAQVRKPVHKLYLDTNSTNITTSAWVEVDASIDEPASAVELFNGSGRLLKLALGAAASEVEIPYYLSPGGSSILVSLYDFPKGSRLSVRAVDATASSGLIVFNFFA